LFLVVSRATLTLPAIRCRSVSFDLFGRSLQHSHGRCQVVRVKARQGDRSNFGEWVGELLPQLPTGGGQRDESLALVRRGWRLFDEAFADECGDDAAEAGSFDVQGRPQVALRGGAVRVELVEDRPL